MGKLDGKVAIITGASSGIGAAQARLFAREGAAVIVADVDMVKGEAVAAELGANALFVRHDVASEESWANVADVAEGRFGPPTILVNTAGAVFIRPLVDTTAADFERLFRINQLGVFLGIRQMVDPMTRAGGGAVVNISSVGGMGGLLGLCAYGSTKWGMRGIARTAAKELAPLNIRVNTIFPGAIDTPMAASTISVFDKQVKNHKLPMGRMGTPDEIATATLFLASDDASYVLGAELVVDGGQVA